MKSVAIAFITLWAITPLSAQTNLLVTNPEAEAVLLGNFDPANYAPAVVIDDPAAIATGLVNGISPDSLHAYLLQMSAFGNRSSGADTVSATFGIGAARRWAYQKFQSFSAQHENRLLVSYFQFDLPICAMNRHRNIMAVLPGQGPQYDEVVLVEAHLDSRCEDECDPDCIAHGMEDNGSGSALVLELARVMSAYSYNRTIVFLLTTAEEQGLLGADAFADYCDLNDVKLKAVLNNDIIGGVICGATASPPGCPGLNSVDSINVRIYSQGTTNSRNKQLARFIKLEFQENVAPLMPVKPVINIMTPEDRTGRGGDHIPFRQKGFAAVRFTSANEHGNGDPNGTPNYEDRQHTTDDVLGLDTDNDGLLDSFFVDFNYLARNAVVNGNALGMAAAGPVTPTNFNLAGIDNGFEVSFEDSYNYGVYRVGVRTFATNDWDTVYTIYQTTDSLYGLAPGNIYVVSVASVDADGVESLFSNERFDNFTTDTREIPAAQQNVELLQNRPNPFDEATVISVYVEQALDYREAFIAVYSMQGKELARLPIALQPGLNEVTYDYDHHSYVPGTYAYSLVIDGQVVATRQMVYAY